MGDRVEASALVVGHDHEVQRRLQRCVAALRRMVDDGWFVGHEDTIGMEVELDLVDPLGRPRLINDAVLARLGRADMQHELGQFNVELNLAPRRLQGRVLRDSEAELAEVLDACRARIEGLGARLVAVGMLPTLSAEQLTVERISHNPRYELLAGACALLATGRSLVRIVDGCEPVEFTTDSVAPDAAATSLQLHLRVPPDRFAAYYNAAQTIAGAQVAVAANSPYLLGYQAWQETRITAVGAAARHPPSQGGPDRRTGACSPRRPVDRRPRGALRRPRAATFRRCFRRWRPRIPMPPSMPGVFRACVSFGCTTARCGAGTVRSTTSRPGARSCASRTGCCPADRPPSTWSPTPRSTTDWSARSSTRDPARWEQMPFAVAERDLHRAARDGSGGATVLARRRLPGRSAHP